MSPVFCSLSMGDSWPDRFFGAKKSEVQACPSKTYLLTLDSAMLRKTFVMLSAPPSER
jgi:hypothetical protein